MKSAPLATRLVRRLDPELARELAARVVVVLAGGRSSEREVSRVSGAAIAAALRSPAGEPRTPASVLEVEVAADGRWRVEGTALRPERALERLPSDALFFLGLHGGEGEDGRVQGFLEVAGRRYTGSGPSASSLCMDKAVSRAVFAAAGARVAPGRIVRTRDWPSGGREVLAAIGELIAAGAGAVYVKPRRGGSSVGTARATGLEAAAREIESIHAASDDALVEAEVKGLEVTAGVLGNASEPPLALPVVEILPRRGDFFDYDEKYADDGASELCPPRTLSEAAQARVQETACVCYEAAGCEGYARVDLIVPREDGAFGEPVVLEANTLPGFTPRSLLPRAAAALGLTFRELCLEICCLALARAAGPPGDPARPGGECVA